MEHTEQYSGLTKEEKLELRLRMQESEARRQKLERLTEQIMMALVGAVDAKDQYTNGHSFRVAKYAKAIAEELGMTKDECENIYYMGLLHDIGKIGIPDYIIHKKSSLTEEEFQLIQQHPVIGAHILERIREIPGLATGARWHHERFDGTGYPDGLKGEGIPKAARIICVADAYDAMTSTRTYSKTKTQQDVRQEMVNGKGVQFDPKIADAMIALIDKDTEYRMRAE